MNVESKILGFMELQRTITRNLPLVEGKMFTGDEVYLDFKEWRNCMFHDCVIVVTYGVFKAVGNNFNGCTFIADEGTPAHAVLSLDHMIKESSNKERDK